MPKGSLPVLVGVGQAVSHWDGTQPASEAPSPHSLNVDATRVALADAGIVPEIPAEPTPAHNEGQVSDLPDRVVEDAQAPTNAPQN